MMPRMVIDRPIARARIDEAFSVHPAVALTGPRQCGKTTLARAVAAAEPVDVRVERPGDMLELPIAQAVLVAPLLELPGLVGAKRPSGRKEGLAGGVFVRPLRVMISRRHSGKRGSVAPKSPIGADGSPIPTNRRPLRHRVPEQRPVSCHSSVMRIGFDDSDHGPGRIRSAGHRMRQSDSVPCS